MDIINCFQSGMLILKEVGNHEYAPLYFNDSFASMLGYEREEMQSVLACDKDIVYPADREYIARATDEVEKAGDGIETCRMLCKQGNVIWVLSKAKKTTYQGDNVLCISYTDITHLMGAQIKLEESSNMWMDIANSVPVGLLIFSMEGEDTTIIAVNDSLVSFSNYIGELLDGVSRNWEKEQLMMLFGQNIYAFCHHEDVYLVREMLQESHRIPTANCTFRLRGSDENKTIWVYSQCSSKQVSDTCRNYYVTFQDVTKEILQEQELRENHGKLLDISYHDALTGVRNRNSFDQYIAYCKEHRQSKVGVVFADVNGLKEVNDTMGHVYGDHMIIDFATMLKEAFSKENVFRVSGDEFVVIIPNIEKMEFQRRVNHLLNCIYDHDKIASLGYIWKDHVSDIKRRTSQAEQLMYVEKQRYYEERRNTQSKRRSKLLDELQEDMKQGRYVMYLQPKANIDGKNVVGAEALVRRIAADGTVVPPYEFVPVLEKEKLIPLVDFYILEEACKFLDRLSRKGNHTFKISVNMSRITMAENDYIFNIISICNKYDVRREQLEFEITESTQAIDNMRLEKEISELKKLGFGVSLDDVGTEYSSIPMLTMDGIDTVKLDRSFIVKMKNPKVEKLIGYMVEISHDLGLKVIAEGVETDEERENLQQKQCDMYQGYLLSKPIPAADFKERYLTE